LHAQPQAAFIPDFADSCSSSCATTQYFYVYTTYIAAQPALLA